MIACSCHVTYAFQTESTLYSLRTKWLWVRVQLQSLKGHDDENKTHLGNCDNIA